MHARVQPEYSGVQKMVNTDKPKDNNVVHRWQEQAACRNNRPISVFLQVDRQTSRL